jgi:hypothetical protein
MTEAAQTGMSILYAPGVVIRRGIRREPRWRGAGSLAIPSRLHARPRRGMPGLGRHYRIRTTSAPTVQRWGERGGSRGLPLPGVSIGLVAPSRLLNADLLCR